MRISFFSVFKPYRGGIAQFSDSLLEVLSESHQVQKVNFKRQYPGFLFPGKSQFIEGFSNDSADNAMVFDSVNPFSWFKTARLIRKMDADVLLVSYWMSFFAFQKSRVLAKSASKLKIGLLHNLVPHEPKFYDRWANKLFVNRCDAFVVLSEQVEKDLLTLKPDARCLKLEHPVYSHFGQKLDCETARKQLGIENDAQVLLFFGLIRSYKGLDDLLKALSLTKQNVQLLIAGESYEDFRSYERLIHELDLKEKISIHTRFIPDEEIPVFFSAANVCVLPYKTATQSGVTAVAQHFELPVIATKVGGLPEVIRHEVDGLLVSPENPMDLAQAIDTYFERGLQEAFSGKVKQRKSELSWVHFSSKLIAFIEELKK